ncbi:tail protein X [Bartonella krasnovii]|uniref:Tail protein X n=1 Tax=Bartonella krasnovii TaxID=2267275 RepID=A0A5B9D212_9HYPH|nr:tail protein X [Bartonella krasnovii]QEE12518.1 P2-like prophage tail protein X [Bartonella krasnovii]QEE12603.1 P2-like prophage tail protein X [Bartonella krasnovii]UNF28708.1 tail protein X [Bartonella krasnovii]UNF37680.1 tail protein X [Bartonella krasnovii]UNF38340.1 tail protein X [Bartonella krasnovii]
MKIPAKQLVIELEDMSLDLICYHHALSVLGDRRQAGSLRGYLEATLEANPEIAGYDTFLPRGLKVFLPEFIPQEKNSVVKRLWD